MRLLLNTVMGLTLLAVSTPTHAAVINSTDITTAPAMSPSTASLAASWLRV